MQRKTIAGHRLALQKFLSSPCHRPVYYILAGLVTQVLSLTVINYMKGGGTGQSDVPEGIDSNGHPTLTSNPSNASGNAYPPWRSNYRGDYRDLPEQPLCTRDLLCWAFQIARGMDYLARRKVCYRTKDPNCVIEITV